MKLSNEKGKLKIQNLKIESFITDLDEHAKSIRGGGSGSNDPNWTAEFCPSTHSFMNCKTKL